MTAVKTFAKTELIKMRKANLYASLVQNGFTVISMQQNQFNAMLENFAVVDLHLLHKHLAQQVLTARQRMVHLPQIRSVFFVQLVLPVRTLERLMIQTKLTALQVTFVQKDNLYQTSLSLSVQKDTTVHNRVHFQKHVSLAHSTHL